MSDERDNLDRVSQGGSEEKGIIEGGPDPLDFPSPTQVVDLPSLGKFYPDDNPIKGKHEVELQSMTANEEEVLSNRDLVQKGEAVDRVLSSILQDDDLGPNHFLVGDKDALLIAARIDAYSAKYDVKIPCPICNQTADYEYDMTEIAEVDHGGVGSLDEEKREKHDVEKIDDHLFRAVLPQTERRVVFRLLMGKDVRKITTKKRRLEKENIDFKEGMEQMKSYIVAVNGVKKQGVINQFVDKVPAKDARMLRNIYDSMKPEKKLIGEFDCKNVNCSFYEERTVPIRGTFFWPDRG